MVLYFARLLYHKVNVFLIQYFTSLPIIYNYRRTRTAPSVPTLIAPFCNPVPRGRLPLTSISKRSLIPGATTFLRTSHRRARPSYSNSSFSNSSSNYNSNGNSSNSTGPNLPCLNLLCRPNSLRPNKSILVLLPKTRSLS